MAGMATTDMVTPDLSQWQLAAVTLALKRSSCMEGTNFGWPCSSSRSLTCCVVTCHPALRISAFNAFLTAIIFTAILVPELISVEVETSHYIRAGFRYP